MKGIKSITAEGRVRLRKVSRWMKGIKGIIAEGRVRLRKVSRRCHRLNYCYYQRCG
jgi:hypothetical protein